MAKGINTSFRDALLARVMDYAAQGGMSAQDAVRELVELGLSQGTMEDVVLQNARQRAYDDTRRFVHNAFSEKLTELSRDMEKQLGIEIWGSKTPRTEGGK